MNLYRHLPSGISGRFCCSSHRNKPKARELFNRYFIKKFPSRNSTPSRLGGVFLLKINKEIQSYSESMFFGLSMRQCGFSLAAMLVAVGLYFLLKPYVGTETVSWMCILGAAPFAAMGFINYHGMTAEQLAWAWFRSEVLEPKKLICEPDNLYYKLLEETISNHEKEAYKK